MEVSRVSFTQQTRQAMSNPNLSRKKKLKLRQQLVFEYIRSKPAGTPLTIIELARAGGWKPGAGGWNGINNMIKNKLLVKSDAPGERGSIWTISADARVVNPGFAKVTTNPETVNEVRNESGKPECRCSVFPFTPHSHLTTDKVSENIRPDVKQPFVYTKGYFTDKAKQFAWEHNSDSLREFISTLS